MTAFRIILLAEVPFAIPVLVRLFVEEWYSWYGPEGSGNAEADLKRCYNREKLPIALVALNAESEVLGTISLKQESLGSEYGFTPWAAAMVVQPAYRRRGVGNALIEAIENLGKRLGFDALYASTDSASGILLKRNWTATGLTAKSQRGSVSIYAKLLV